MHISILLTQGPIHEIFTIFFWEFTILKNSVFLSLPFWNFFFCFIPMKIVKATWVSRKGRNITLVYSKTVSVRNNLLHSLCSPNIKQKRLFYIYFILAFVFSKLWFYSPKAFTMLIMAKLKLCSTKFFRYLSDGFHNLSGILMQWQIRIYFLWKFSW